MNLTDFVVSGKLGEKVKILEEGLEAIKTGLASGNFTFLEAYARGTVVLAQVFDGFESVRPSYYELTRFKSKNVDEGSVSRVVTLKNTLGHAIYFNISIGSSFNIKYNELIHVVKTFLVPNGATAMSRGKDLEIDKITFRQEVKADDYESFVAGIVSAIYNLDSTGSIMEGRCVV